MAETDETLVSTYDAFAAARGEQHDSTWAFTVSWKLMMNDVAVGQVRAGLEEALAVVRETQEDPEVLFGTPHEHATELYRRWKSEERLELTRGVGIPNARSVPASSLRTGSWFAVVMFAVSLFDDSDLTAGFLVLPLGLGFATIGGLALWEWVSRRWATPVAVAAMTAATIAVVGFLVAVLDLGSGTSLGWAGPWLLLVEAAVLGSAGRMMHVLVTAKEYKAARDGLADDDAWVHRFSSILRGPGWHREARVREIVAEARSHAAESGRTLAEEFGTPEQYAARIRVDSARRIRFKIAFLGLLIALNLVPLADGFSWANAAMAVLLAWLAWREHQKYRKLRSKAA